MNQVANWFERKFEFTFPAQLFPNLCARLRGTPARLEEQLRACERLLLVQKTESQWSIQEHAGHLLDLESLWLARVEDYASGAAQLTPADLRNQKTHEANHNAKPLSEILAAFRSARLELVDRVTGVPAEAFARTLPHPRLQQPMRLVDHMFFAAEHDDHHLAKMWELAKHS